jgi:chorismate mutase
MRAPMSDEQRLWAVRGAVKVDSNDTEAIVGATEAVMRELMSRNEIAPDRIVSCLFPAVAARRLGLDAVPLLCTRELDVPGAMRSVIRVLVHYYARPDHVPRHAYLGKAQELRADLHSAQ